MVELKKPMMVYALPSDPSVLAAIGKVAVRHGQLDHALRMVIKTLTSVTPEQALDATERAGSSELRERILKLAKQRLGEGAPLVKLQAIIARSRRATDRRNHLLHGIWAEHLDGSGFLMEGDRSLSAVPKRSWRH